MGHDTHTLLTWFRRCAVVHAVMGIALGGLLLSASPEEVQAVEINVLAAGATESIIRDMVGTFEKESGHTVRLTYAPVGALRDKIFAGERADLTIVTPVIIEQLQAKGVVQSATRTDLGRVGGGIAVRLGAPHPAYFLQVADRLGIGDEVRKKGRTAGGGKVSMELMAKSTASAIGLTQISEILSVKEVVLVGPYPGNLQNMTTYTGILLKDTPHAEAGGAFLRFLMSPPVQARFKQAGYEPVR
jgi:molybdate transport system substrate-binding protein